MAIIVLSIVSLIRSFEAPHLDNFDNTNRAAENRLYKTLPRMVVLVEIWAPKYLKLISTLIRALILVHTFCFNQKADAWISREIVGLTHLVDMCG